MEKYVLTITEYVLDKSDQKSFHYTVYLYDSMEEALAFCEDNVYDTMWGEEYESRWWDEASYGNLIKSHISSSDAVTRTINNVLTQEYIHIEIWRKGIKNGKLAFGEFFRYN